VDILSKSKALPANMGTAAVEGTQSGQRLEWHIRRVQKRGEDIDARLKKDSHHQTNWFSITRV